MWVRDYQPCSKLQKKKKEKKKKRPFNYIDIFTSNVNIDEKPLLTLKGRRKSHSVGSQKDYLFLFKFLSFSWSWKGCLLRNENEK